MSFPSKLVENAVNEIAKLPGIGKKTALRLTLFLLKADQNYTKQLAKSLLKLRKEIQYCHHCFSISDKDTCSICKMPSRNKDLVCVIETSSDLLAIEKTAQYNGLYHVLGGKISPVEGIGLGDIRIKELIDRVAEGKIKEVILALSATMDSDTTAFYLIKKLKNYDIKISAIARGIPIGNEIEYTDEITLGRSIVERIKCI